MRKFILTLVFAFISSNAIMAQTKTVHLRIIETSDIHGSFFPYDFINRKPRKGSLARISTHVNLLRQQYGRNLILLENGDILQGQPTCYYYNYINTGTTNIAADLVNYMQYDVQTIGNHDLETGHNVYDKWISEIKCPVLGANVVDAQTGKPYLKPYIILEREGVKIAILGLLTPAIPNWLSENLWNGLKFEDMLSCARKWMSYIQENEKPDVVIGLFHSGYDGGIATNDYRENATAQIAREVPGFDVIFYGHDHIRRVETLKNIEGKEVVVIDPANNAMYVADTEITITQENNKTLTKVNAKLTNVSDLPIDEGFMQRFKHEYREVDKFVNKKIGKFQNTISTRDSYFGSSAFNDLILNLSLKITGADVAFNAPLAFDAEIKKGPVRVADMFNLYKFENQLYVMSLTGEEIRRHLEMSYDQWVNTMKSPEDHLLLLSPDTRDDQQRLGFQNYTFNFDSAAGIDYEVDVTKPDGHKVRILRMSNGQPFDEAKYYKVAINSYRGNGGGELLTKGAGIPQEELKNRIVWSSEKDQRYYLMEEIEKTKAMAPAANNNWRFIPDEWVRPAAERDREILFNKK
ncbi:bifunctional UDP-sugar hydrolase/5'-nucleotidase [Prevotella sp. KH2C16]|uniref:bifunctional metallophosphatase/5'-nucleotidase n=1 Tax=Prevotella sp. KH2C16 TaxID=1855325 RepID=UPI0008E1D2BB|nr:2',3'-cyclic-nucleotide 2'-phosphodiesterase / 3'-nucleotidase [Prevotella sp. KH2C16]